MAESDASEKPAGNGVAVEKSFSAENSTKKDASPAGASNDTKPDARDDPKDYIKVEWDGDDDPESPKNMKHSRKWVVVILVSAASSLTTCTSSMYTLTYAQITKEFHISTVVATLGLSLYVAGLGVGPMVIAPLSEFYGRRPIYFFSFIFLIIFLIPCAVARNTATMMMGRFLDGVAGSAFLSVAGGSVGDMFTRTQLQKPMMIFSASPFVGPPVGPVIAGFINQYTNWRWTFYVLIIWSVFMLLLLMALVPETYSPVLLKHKAARLRRETGDGRYRASIEMMKKSIARTVLTSTYRPFQLLIYEPMVLNLCLYSALLLGLLYLFFGAFEVVFTTNHHFNLWQVGMSFTGLLAGTIIAVCTDPYWHKKYLELVRRREQETGEKGGSEPEFRLPSAILGGILVPIGLFWFGWTTYSSILWIVPIIGSAVFSCGMLFVFSGVFTFLVEAYPLYAASALAANGFARCSFAAAFPLFGVQMYNKLGFQWATTLLALLTCIMAPFPYIFYRYGKRIRKGSRYATGR